MFFLDPIDDVDDELCSVLWFLFVSDCFNSVCEFEEFNDSLLVILIFGVVLILLTLEREHEWDVKSESEGEEKAARFLLELSSQTNSTFTFNAIRWSLQYISNASSSKYFNKFLI